MSVVPPPMSTIMLPVGSVMGSPAPMAAATGSSTRNTSLAFARSVLSRTARRSTSVISAGTPTMTRGRTQELRGCALRMKSVSMRSAASKSAITPSRSGPDGHHVLRRAPHHLLGFRAHGLDAARHLVERHHRRLVQDDAAAGGEDAGVGRAQVDGQVGRKGEGKHLAESHR